MQVGRIGKYRIIAKLGQGGMATVFLSVVPGPVGFNKLLVVKVLKEELSQDPDFLAMFLNEARLAARLNHANVVHTYEVGVEDGQHFLAMDFLDGQPLHAILRRATRAKMPLDIHVRIIADALAGLHYAHTLHDFDGSPVFVVHRDVSPQNVFVTYDGQVKVVDFGIAKAVGAATTTQSGMFKGKMAYVAPEQAAGDPVDARADLFSVGVMLWEAMACTRFAHGDSQTTILARRLAGTEPRIRQVVPDADAELAEICDRAMAHRPADRYPSAQAFRDALEGFLDRFSRRVGSREVGELLSRLFAEDREAIRKVIDEQLKRVMRETSGSLPVPTLDAHPTSGDPTPLSKRDNVRTFRDDPTVPEGAAPLSDPPAARFGGQLDSASEHTPRTTSQVTGTMATANISQRPQPARSSTRAVMTLLALLALASVTGIVLVFVVKSGAPAAAPPGASVASAAASPAPSAAATGDKIRLSITFGPSGATAKLDGVPLAGSPFVATVDRDGSMHRIDVEGPGFERQTQMVSFDKDVTIDVTLSLSLADAAPSGAPTAGPAGVGRPQPGGDRPGKNPKQTREIDEQDPYKK